MVEKRILRKNEVLERLGIRKTTLHAKFHQNREVALRQDRRPRRRCQSLQQQTATGEVISRCFPAQETCHHAISFAEVTGTC